jgi:hypothetical protein
MTPYHNCLMDHHHFAGSTSSLSVSWLVSHAGWVFFGSLTVLASQMLEHSNLTNNSKRLQAYYGPGVLPPTYFAPPMAPGHPHTPYMWGPQVFVFFISLRNDVLYTILNLNPLSASLQPMMAPPFGTPYAAMYPHGGAYPHPLMPMVNIRSSCASLHFV